MGAIDNYLAAIGSAVYGEEVRSSIINGIRQCYTDAVDVVKVSTTQPTSENTKIWIKPESDEYKVPTWDEFQALQNTVSTEEAARQYGDGVAFNDIAEIYDETHAYDPGKMVIQEGGGTLYLLPNGHTANQTWESTDKEIVNLADQLNSKTEVLESALNVVEEQFLGISGEILPPSFEIGQRSINGSNSEVWAENSKRLTFTRGSYLNLKQGDTVECDTSVIASYFGGYTTNGGTSFTAISTQTGKYTIPVNGVYFFTLNKVGSGDFTPNDVINGWKYITFTRSGSIKEDVDDLSERVDSFEQIYTQIENGHTVLTLEWTQSEYIKSSTGKITAGGNSFYSTEQFYSIDKNAFKIEVNNIHAYSGLSCSVAFYTSDSEDAFISCVETDNPVLTSSNIPSTAKYMRFCHQTANNPVTDVSCVAYYFERLNEIEETAQAAKESADAVAENYIIPTIKDVLIDKTTISGKQPWQLAGKTMYDYIDNANVNSSKPFAVLPQTKYTFAVKSDTYEAAGEIPTMICAYDASGVYIDRYNNFTNPFTTPSGCYYIIVIVTAAKSISNFYVENTEELQMPFDQSIFNDYAKTSLFGKKWLVFGDSITDNNARAAGNYHDFIRAETGCTVINEGINGSGYYQTGGVKSIPSAISDYSGTMPDLVTIMAGINDIMFAVDYTPQILPIGDYTDTGTSSLMGYVYSAYQALLTKFPLVPFAIMSPIPEISYPQTNINNSLKEFVEELEKFCNYYGIPFLDQYSNSPLKPWVTTFNQKYFSSISAPSGDGLHPNYYGQRMLYPRIREFIKTLL